MRAGLAALLHCELALAMRLPGAEAPWTTLHMPVGIVWLSVHAALSM